MFGTMAHLFTQSSEKCLVQWYMLDGRLTNSEEYCANSAVQASLGSSNYLYWPRQTTRQTSNLVRTCYSNSDEKCITATSEIDRLALQLNVTQCVVHYTRFEGVEPSILLLVSCQL